MMDFKTNVKTGRLVNVESMYPRLETFDVEIDSHIEWSFDVDARNGGIKSMDCTVKRVYGDVIITEWGQADEEDKKHHFVFDTKEGFEIETLLEVKGGYVWPEEIKIYLKEKLVEVE